MNHLANAAFPICFKESTKIYFKLKAQEYVKLQILDREGNILATKVDAFLEEGDYTIPVKSDKFKQYGHYYYKLQVGEYKVLRSLLYIAG